MPHQLATAIDPDGLQGHEKTSTTTSRRRLALKTEALEEDLGNNEPAGQTAQTRRVRWNLLDDPPVAGEGHVVDLDGCLRAWDWHRTRSASPSPELARALGLKAAFADAAAGGCSARRWRTRCSRQWRRPAASPRVRACAGWAPLPMDGRWRRLPEPAPATSSAAGHRAQPVMAVTSTKSN